MMEKHQML